LGKRGETEADVIGKFANGHLTIAQMAKNQQSLLVRQSLQQLGRGIGTLQQSRRDAEIRGVF
jgi:hypothetical protein